MQISRCLDPGMTLIVGTANAQNVPVCCRAVALSSRDDAATVTVYLPVATSHETVQNLATTRRIAITATDPIDHCSIQLKGTTDDARLARDDEARFVGERFRAIADSLDRIGIPARVTGNAAWWPAFAVSVRIDEIYDQTPGPKAGTRVR
jgi:hypothetical protein